VTIKRGLNDYQAMLRTLNICFCIECTIVITQKSRFPFCMVM